jgi:hypothetical protein
MHACMWITRTFELILNVASIYIIYDIDIAAKADIPAQNIVVRFSEAVDGFPLPKGHDVTNCNVFEDEKDQSR